MKKPIKFRRFWRTASDGEEHYAFFRFHSKKPGSFRIVVDGSTWTVYLGKNPVLKQCEDCPQSAKHNAERVLSTLEIAIREIERICDTEKEGFIQ